MQLQRSICDTIIIAISGRQRPLTDKIEHQYRTIMSLANNKGRWHTYWKLVEHKLN